MSILRLGRATFTERVIDPKEIKNFPYGLAEEMLDGYRIVVES